MEALLPAASGGAFTVTEGKGELFVLVRHAQSVSLQMRTPAGQLLTRANVWRAGRWYADEVVDAISIDTPAVGVWQLLGMDSTATVVVLRTPRLEPQNLPEFVLSNKPSVLRWQLQSHGVAIPALAGPALAGSASAFGELVIARARLRAADTAEQDVPVERTADGTLQVALPGLAASSYSVDLDVWVKTLHVHTRHHITAWTFPTVQVERRGSNAILWVKFESAGLDAASMGVVAAVLAPNHQKRLLPAARLLNGTFCVFVAGSDWRGVAGDLRVNLQLQGRARGGAVWRAPEQVVVMPWLVPRAQAHIYAAGAAPPARGASAGQTLPIARAPPSINVNGNTSFAAAGDGAAPTAMTAAQQTRSPSPVERHTHPAARVALRQLHVPPHHMPAATRRSGPSVWYLSGLAVDNLVLIGLLAWRARRATQKHGNAFPRNADAPLQTPEAHAAGPESETAELASPAAVDASNIASSTAPAEVTSDGDPPIQGGVLADVLDAEPDTDLAAAPTPEVEEVAVDTALLEDLAAMAATQSDLRAAAVAQAEVS